MRLQINELRPPRNEYQSFPSFTDLNSKLTDKEDEINRLMAENISKKILIKFSHNKLDLQATFFNIKFH